MSPGFNKNILRALQIKVWHLPAAGKLVCIAMDEYDPKRDIVEAFDGEVLADHASAFTVQGVIHRWKQSFGYFFSSGLISAMRMKGLLFEAIDCLESIGLTVTVVVPDQGSNNVSLFESQLDVLIVNPIVRSAPPD